MNVKEIFDRLQKDASFVLGVNIPADENEVPAISHNLPWPDFDETGFIGRRREVNQLVKLCLGAYPVVTILGEGGIGKTALALKVAYEVLDLPLCPFDAIVWTTSKTSQLTNHEIVEINGAIKDSLGLFESVARQLSGTNASTPVEEVLGYMSEFKILLILDNLETVLDDRTRSFLEHLPIGSKVLLTSRIGLGAFEYPVPLKAMDDSEAIQLVRALATIRGVRQLVEMPNSRLSTFCHRMKNNPGFIKWFVAAVHIGQRPEDVLSDPSVFLEFCMSNVYEYLSQPSRAVLAVMLSVSGRHTLADLSYLSEMDVMELKRSLQQLLATSMVTMTCIPRGASFETQYELSDLARAYLSRHHPVGSGDLKIYSTRKRKLVAAGEEVRAQMETNPYSFFALSIRSKNDLAICKYLLDSLKRWQIKSYDQAEILVNNAEELSPDYFEVYRVKALIHATRGNVTEALRAYEGAIELKPDHAPLRLWFGGFLMRYMQDVEGAFGQLKRAYDLDPKSSEIHIELARANLYLKHFDEAKKLLDSLLSKSELGVWRLRQLHDLRIQYFHRLSEHRLLQHDEIGALAAFEGLRKEYELCPVELRDDKIRSRLEKAIPTLTQCMRVATNAHETRQGGRLLDWLKVQTGLPLGDNGLRGVVIRLHETGEFGFIRSDDGNEYYFNSKATRHRSERGQIREGERVSFMLSTNEIGACAIQVCRL